MKLVEDIDDLATKARLRAERGFAQASAQLEAHHQPFVAAHFAFAALHMALALAQARLMKNTIQTELVAQGAEIILRVAPRRLVCRFALHQNVIESLFVVEHEQGEIKRLLWSPPPVVNVAMIYEWTHSVVHQMVAFVTGEQ